MDVKTDNRSLATKVALRRALLDAAGWDTVGVLDLCAGEGHIWDAMRAHVQLARYVPCDRAPRRAGTLKGEALMWAARLDLSPFEVIDIDTYGEPWQVYDTILRRLARRTAVFLTHGQQGIGVMLSHHAKRTMGLPTAWDVPRSKELARLAGSYCLRETWKRATIVSAVQAVFPGVTYYGLLLDPITRPDDRANGRRG